MWGCWQDLIFQTWELYNATFHGPFKLLLPSIIISGLPPTPVILKGINSVYLKVLSGFKALRTGQGGGHNNFMLAKKLLTYANRVNKGEEKE